MQNSYQSASVILAPKHPYINYKYCNKMAQQIEYQYNMPEWLEISAWSIGTDLDEPPYFRDKNEECDEEIDEYWSDEL